MRDVRFNFLAEQASKSNYAQALLAASTARSQQATIQTAFGTLFSLNNTLVSGVYTGTGINNDTTPDGNSYTITGLGALNFDTLPTPPNVQVYMYGRAVSPPLGSVLAQFVYTSANALPYRLCKTIVLHTNASTNGILSATVNGTTDTPTNNPGNNVQCAWVIINNKGVLSVVAA